MADGIASRPAIFKKNMEVALILNLVIGLKQGQISFLEWRNSCYEDQGCDPQDCKDTSITFDGTDHNEANCLQQNCKDMGSPKCDTQVYLTWVGRDNDRDDCTSDNYRLSSFFNFSMVSYLNAAKNLVTFNP